MTVDEGLIGRRTAPVRVLVERAPVAVFAAALKDGSRCYRDPAAAAAEGFAAIPVPPTFALVMRHWGAYPELQSEPGEHEDFSPFEAVLAPLLARGGILLHGEQEFVYHRPVLVGDLLAGQGVVVDLYEKERSGAVMTFLVIETRWSDDATGEPVVTETSNLIHRRAIGAS